MSKLTPKKASGTDLVPHGRPRHLKLPLGLRNGPASYAKLCLAVVSLRWIVGGQFPWTGDTDHVLIGDKCGLSYCGVSTSGK